MTKGEWEKFCTFRNEFRTVVDEWKNKVNGLLQLEQKIALDCKTPAYSFENPVVYNTDLDRFTQDDEIKLIVIGDNPGKDEQLSKNLKYLVGQAGKIAEGYFRRNGELGIDFRKNVIILNKTPIHSAKTNQLKQIVKLGGPEVLQLFEETQRWMAKKTSQLHADLQDGMQKTELWLVGYAELKAKGIFTLYRDEFRAAYQKSEKLKQAWENVYVFQHFSMNRFSIDLNENMVKQLSLQENIHQLGKQHKIEIFE